MTPSFFSYSPKTTSVNFPWPSDVTGIERIALSAQGDLQRILSAFFARPITIGLVCSRTTTQSGDPDSPGVPLNLPNPTAVAAASSDAPIMQIRQVNLQCAGQVVCVATSTIRITCASYAHLFLEEGYAIGQMFSRMGKIPAFELISVGTGPINDVPEIVSKSISFQHNDAQLWRKYKLSVPGFECHILEVFPSRDMFVMGDRWLNERQWEKGSIGRGASEIPTREPSLWVALVLSLVFIFLLTVTYRLYIASAESQKTCWIV